jgi:hypothetical protein
MRMRIRNTAKHFQELELNDTGKKVANTTYCGYRKYKYKKVGSALSNAGVRG